MADCLRLLVDPLFQVEGTSYIWMRTDQKQSRLSRMRSRSSIPVYFPVTPNIFPVRGQKIPGYAATGIRPQAIDESAPFSEPNGRRKAEPTRFPVIFSVHGNLPPASVAADGPRTAPISAMVSAFARTTRVGAPFAAKVRGGW
jgi:hypothetical protein